MGEMQSRLWSLRDSGKGAFVDNDYIRAETLEEAGKHRALLPLCAWLELAGRGHGAALSRMGVFIAADEDIEPLLAFLDKIPVIALDIPVFTDGRAYSKAMKLKTRYHFKGEIRAVGDILPDQFSNLLRSGFNVLEVSNKMAIRRLEEGRVFIAPGYYQPGEGLAKQPDARIWRRSYV